MSETAAPAVRMQRYARWTSSFPFNATCIRLHELGQARIQGPQTFSCPPGRDCVFFAYALEGGGILRRPEGEERLEQGWALCLNTMPGFVLDIQGEFCLSWIYMSGELANKLMDFIHRDCRGVIFPLDANVLPLFDGIYDLARMKPWSRHRDLEISAQLYYLLGHIHMPLDTRRRTEPALNHIHAHLGEDLSIALLARLCLMSPHHFARRFHQETGLPPHRYVLHCRVEKAKELLLSTDMPVFLIAEETGFQEPAYFTRAFKRVTGVLPRDFRKRGPAAQTLRRE